MKVEERIVEVKEDGVKIDEVMDGDEEIVEAEKELLWLRKKFYSGDG